MTKSLTNIRKTKKKEKEDILKDTRWRVMRMAGAGFKSKKQKIDSNDYVIAIPSYKRQITLKNKTLKFLEEQNIQKKKIFIFVGNKNEEIEYTKILPEYKKQIIVGEVGMSNIRNFISNYFKEGQKIFNIDDDITSFEKLVEIDGKKKLQRFIGNDLDNFIKKGFSECLKTNLTLFGIYPASNPFFMKDRITYDLRYIIGSCWGSINSRKIKVSMHDKEDFERTLKYYIKDGGVIRFENTTVMSGYYKEKGGMQETRTKQRVLESAEKLVEMYPKLCKLYLGKKSGYAEVKLKDAHKEFQKKILL